MPQEFLLGNGAIALGLLEGGCQVVTSYPGTPSSEILPEVDRLMKSEKLETYIEWSTNEKVALDIAFAAAISGKRAACCMKQVGLNVAADSLLSAAYLGTTGALVIISCDDPGPHSSQTEQDSRWMARLAKVPVLDPSTPQEAREMVRLGLDLSAEFNLPILLRPTIRVCHGRQNLSWKKITRQASKANFIKDPKRWAATPKFRYLLHKELNQKLKGIQQRFEAMTPVNFHDLKPGRSYALGIVAAGVSYAVVKDILEHHGRNDIPVLKLGAPYPFPEGLAADFLGHCEKVLVIEETDTVIEYLLRDRHKVLGRLTGHIPSAGELVPQVVEAAIGRTLGDLGLPMLDKTDDNSVHELVQSLDLPLRKPTLCAGCPHRASFYAIRRAKPKAIFPSDIGCYTLGINLGAVDTCLDMGAAITMAAGFYQAYHLDGVRQPIIATIGDSTFLHSGPAGLINAVYNDARFVLIILDNGTTAMTGMQPSIPSGMRADGSQGNAIALEKVVAGCGIDFIEVVDPYDTQAMIALIKRAAVYAEEPEGGIPVIIARHPCLIDDRAGATAHRVRVTVTEDCDECNFCHERFECPALIKDTTIGRTAVDRSLCSGCGVCIQVCPKNAIVGAS